MSAITDGPGGSQFVGLRELSTELIDANPENPRLVFPRDEIERLAESIDLEGILVPIVVYPDRDRYVLIDGERRYRCARDLGLATVPAVVTRPKSSRENLIQMFNIHLIREPWRDMPTAWALEKLMRQHASEGGRDLSDVELSNITGLSKERIVRLRHALSLPREYQEYIDRGEIPLNFFWELKRNVIEPLVRQRPKLLHEFSEDEVTEAFVGKRLDGVITDTVSLRNVRPIIGFAAKDAEGTSRDESILDSTIRDLVKDPELTIETAYDDSIQIMVEADKLERRTANMLTSFRRLLGRVRTDEEKARVITIGNLFVTDLKRLLKM